MDPKKSRDLRLGGDAAATPLLGPGRGKIWGVIAVIWVQNGVFFLKGAPPSCSVFPGAGDQWGEGEMGWFGTSWGQ